MDELTFSNPSSNFTTSTDKRNRKNLTVAVQPLPHNKYVKEVARRAVEKLTNERDFPNAVPSGRIAFTEWFGKGLPPDQYAKTLANTKIAICPPGFISSETIRHGEAMRLGCVVISAPLPPNRFYKDSPIIQLPDWSELKPLLKDLLSNPEELRLRHEATVDWWDRKFSEAAVADYMASVLESSPR